jgi:hypothetical protein
MQRFVGVRLIETELEKPLLLLLGYGSELGVFTIL